MENKSARDRAEEIISNLKQQARVLGSSGKGYGDFARVNREAARLIQELLEAEELKDQMIDCYKQERDMCKNQTHLYASQLLTEQEEKRSLEEKLRTMQEKMKKKRNPIILKWRKKNG